MLGRELQCPQTFHISGEGWEGGPWGGGVFLPDALAAGRHRNGSK